MIETTHILAGAVLGAKTHSLPLAAGLGLLSHVALDLIPHRDPKIKFKTRDILIEFLDPILAISILALLFYFKPDLRPQAPVIIIASFFSILPDLFSFIHYIYPKSKFLKVVWRFHLFLHWWEDQTATIESKKAPRLHLWVLYIQPLIVWPVLIYLLFR